MASTLTSTRGLKDGTGRGVTGLLALVAVGCSTAGPAATISPPQQVSPPDVTAAPTEIDDRPWAERTLDGLDLREKVGQMIMPWVLGDYAPEGSGSRRRIVAMIEEHGVGGVIMSVGSPTEVAAKLNDLQRRSSIPLLVAADLETGAGFRMRGAIHMPGTIELGGATDFPPLMALGAAGELSLAYEMGRITAEEARAVGIHVPFAPVLDVNNNPDNPIINVRSFGSDPAQVSRLGAAFVRGVQRHGAVSTGKHFPGHGDTETDSHLALPVIRHNPERLDSVELRPFREAIEAGMGAVMTAHIAVPALDGGNGDPSTLSHDVLTDLLRTRMGFDGLLFTDAMDMSAISQRYESGEAAVRAVLAGADVILMPASVRAAVDGIVEAVRRGDISESRVDASVGRILAAKASLGLHETAAVDLQDIPGRVGVPDNVRVARQIAERSITVLKNGRSLLPLLGTRSARVLSVTYRRRSDVLAGRYFNRRLGQAYPRLATAELDRDSGQGLYDGILRQARRSQLVVISLYVTAVSYSGSVALPDELVELIQALTTTGVPHVVVSFGNPYLVRSFPDVQAYMLAWGGSEASQRAAARALFGEFHVTGHTPTPIPPLYELGEGIRIPAKEATGGAP